jgi:hypothetical protein
MSTLHLSWLLLYLAAAAGYGGWRGRELWSGWGVWCLLLPPLVWAGAKAFADWRRNPYWSSAKIGVVMTVFAVVVVGGPALFLAWIVGDATERWSPTPAVRVMIGVGMVAVVGGLMLWAKVREKPATPVNGNGPDDSMNVT